MLFSKARSRAGEYGVSRRDWEWLELRVVEVQGQWRLVEGNDEHAFPSRLDDMSVGDWKPLDGTEWPMVRHVRQPPPQYGFTW